MKDSRTSSDGGLAFAPLRDLPSGNTLRREREVGSDAKAGLRVARFKERAEQRIAAVGRLDEELGFHFPLRTRFELLDSARPARGVTRQIAAEGEALPFEPGSHEREDERGRADERHYAESFAVRGLDERRARVGDRRATRFGEKAERAALAQRLQQGLGLFADLLNPQLADGHGHFHFG